MQHAFEVPASSKRQFCSLPVTHNQTHSRKAKPLVTVKCANCGKEFERKAWEVEPRKARAGRYCSTACRDAVKRGRKGTERVARISYVCEGVRPHFASGCRMRRERRFCSVECANKAKPGTATEARDAKITTVTEGYVTVYCATGGAPAGRRRRSRHAEHRVRDGEGLGRAGSSPTRRCTTSTATRPTTARRTCSFASAVTARDCASLPVLRLVGHRDRGVAVTGG
jgi:hypothetical protein